MKLQISNVASEESDCTVTKTSEGELYADCSNREQISIRHGLGDALEVPTYSYDIL